MREIFRERRVVFSRRKIVIVLLIEVSYFLAFFLEKPRVVLKFLKGSWKPLESRIRFFNKYDFFSSPGFLPSHFPFFFLRFLIFFSTAKNESCLSRSPLYYVHV